MTVEITRAAAVTSARTGSEVNEDAILKLEELGLYAIADGWNGPAAAETAIATLRRSSKALHDTIAKVAKNRSSAARLSVGRFFERVFQRAGDAVHQLAKRTNQPGLSTTLTAVMFANRYAFIGHVGHSRVYLCRDGGIWQVTSDHVAPASKGDSDDQVLTQALGITPRLDVAFAEVLLNPGDAIVMCSNGLANYVDDKTIGQVVETQHVDTAVHHLMSLACDAGSTDNISVIAVDTGRDEKREPTVDVAATIRNVFLFETMREADRMRVAPYLEEATFEAGEVICAEGDSGDEFFVIISGSVAVTRGDVHLVDLGSGKHFGEISLIHDGRRTATVTATERTLTYKLSRERFDQLVVTKPEIGVRMMQPLLGQLASRVADLTERLVDNKGG